MRAGIRSPAFRITVAALLLAALAGAAVLVLLPTNDLPSKAVRRTSAFLASRGAPSWAADFELVEFLYNVALFVPIVAACALLWRRVSVLAWAGVGLVASLTIEVTQAVFLSGRTPGMRDVVSNTLGALLGAVFARALERVVGWLHRRNT